MAPSLTEAGLEVIDKTKRLRDVVVRNSTGLGSRFVGMTRKEWRRQ